MNVEAPKVLRYKGRWITKKALDRKLKTYGLMHEGKIRMKMAKDAEVQEFLNSKFMIGRHLVDLKVLGKNLKCCSCGALLSLEKIESEKRYGVDSILKIKCQRCYMTTDVRTAKFTIPDEITEKSETNTETETKTEPESETEANELANYEKNVVKNIYKANAYRKAASTLSALPTRVKSGDEAKKLPGIGEKIAKKIDEFLETGKLQKLENINQDESNVAINLLTRVSGIGPAKAKELVDSGIKNIDDLKRNEHLLNHHQKIGLKHFEDFEKKIPRADVSKIEDFIRKAIEELDNKYILTICGSYRRGKSESGDIDVLVTHPSYDSKEKESKKKTIFLKRNILKSIVDHLEKGNFITDTMSLGDSKFMGVCRLPGDEKKEFRRLDIRLAPYDQYYCAVLYFTGSDLFNRNMRAHALEKKFTLNEYSLRRLTPEGLPGEPEKIICEQDIFHILGMPYKDPKDRDI